MALPALVAGCAGGPRLQPGIGRCVWVDRWDYRTAGDIEAVIDRCQRLGFTAVVFQVRGNGTVAFPSAVEIWSERFGYRDPGFDPLATAIRAAHARGMELHAWVNMAPGWVGVDVPEDERQLWQSRRDWFLHDREVAPQRRQPGKYLALNLCLPDVRAYLTDLCREIVTRYEVDGLHLDYIRFPEPEPEASGELGTDPATMVVFSRETGRRPSDTAGLHAWQRSCVTRLVGDVRAAVRDAAPRVKLSAAVFADAGLARERVRQDWPLWCHLGLIDAVVPMNYTDDDARFVANVRAAVAAADGVPVIVGIGVYKHRGPEQSRAQLDAVLAAGGQGIGVFSYRALFGDSAEVSPAQQVAFRRSVGDWLEASARRSR